MVHETVWVFSSEFPNLYFPGFPSCLLIINIRNKNHMDLNSVGTKLWENLCVYVLKIIKFENKSLIF